MTLSSFLPKVLCRAKLNTGSVPLKIKHNYVFSAKIFEHKVSRLSSTISTPFAIKRELPDVKDNRVKYLTLTVSGVLFWGCILSLAFNYQKRHTSIVKSTFFIVKYNKAASELLGKDIDFSSTWPWIHGDINHLKGKIDMSYAVSGSKASGLIHFKSVRRNNNWTVNHFSLTCNGEEVSLLTEDALDNIQHAD